MKAGNIFGNCISLAVGLVFAAAGTFIASIGLGVLPVDSSSVDGAPWMFVGFGLMFFLVGTKVFSAGATPADARQTVFFQTAQALLTGGILLLFGSIFVWVGLQPDENATLVDHLIFVIVGLLIAGWGLSPLVKGLIRFLRGGQGDGDE
ncbi:MAG: hypothetical protein GXP40_06015 [Chloroflexi bacterium]|nr:hypothetical protein [Chloroflexota bacterium]